MSGKRNRANDSMKELFSDSGSDDECTDTSTSLLVGDIPQYVIDQETPVDTENTPPTNTEVRAVDILVIEHLSDERSPDNDSSDHHENDHMILEFPDDSDKTETRFFPVNAKRSNSNLPRSSSKKFRPSTSNNDEDTSSELMSEESSDSFQTPSVVDIANVEDHHHAHRNVAIECNPNNNLNSEKRSDDRKRKSSSRARRSREHDVRLDDDKSTPLKKSKLKDLVDISDGAYADTEDNTTSDPKGIPQSNHILLPQCKTPCEDLLHIFCDRSKIGNPKVDLEKELNADNKRGQKTLADVGGGLSGEASTSAGQPALDRVLNAPGKGKRKCHVCNKKLGLTAIKCRCGGIYCSKHRYDKEHNCTFDYRAMGAEEIRKNNPLVIAEKVAKL